MDIKLGLIFRFVPNFLHFSIRSQIFHNFLWSVRAWVGGMGLSGWVGWWCEQTHSTYASLMTQDAKKQKTEGSIFEKELCCMIPLNKNTNSSFLAQQHCTDNDSFESKNCKATIYLSQKNITLGSLNF